MSGVTINGTLNLKFAVNHSAFNKNLTKLINKIGVLNKRLKNLNHALNVFSLKSINGFNKLRNTIDSFIAKQERLNRSIKDFRKSNSFIRHSNENKTQTKLRSRQKSFDKRFTLGNVSKSLNKAEKKVNKSLKKDIKELSDFSSDLEKIATPIKKILAPSIDFEDVMHKVKLASHGNESEFENLNKTTLELGSKTNFSYADISAGETKLAQKGFSYNQIDTGISGIVYMAAAAGTSISDSTDIGLKILDAYKLKISEMDKVSDVMAFAIKKSTLNIEELSNTLGNVASAANACNVNLGETAALSIKLADMGYKDEKAENILNNAFTSIANPSESGNAAIKQLGVETHDPSGKIRNFNDILSDLYKNTTSENRVSIFSKIFGKDYAEIMIKLSADSAGIKNLAADFQTSAGTAKSMTEEMENTTGGSLRRLNRTLTASAIEIGTIFLPTIKTITDTITNLLPSITAWIKKHETLVSWAGNVTAGLLAFKVALLNVKIAVNVIKSAFIKVLNALIDFLKKIKKAITFLSNQKNITNTLKKFVAHVKNAFSVLRNNFNSFSKKLLSLLTNVWNGLKTFAGKLKSVLSSASNIVKAAFGKLCSALTSTWNIVKSFSGKFLSLLSNVWSSIKNFPVMLKSVLSSAGSIINAFTVILKSAVKGICRVFLAVGRTLMANPILLVIGAIALAAYLIYDNWEAISQWFSNLWNRWGNTVVAVWDLIKSIFLNFTLPGLVIKHWDSICDWFSDRWDDIVNIFKYAIGKISDLINIIPSCVSDIWSGITDIAEQIFAYIGDIINTFLSFFSGAWSGITDFLGFDPLDVVSGIWNNLVGFFDGIWEKIANACANGLNFIKENIGKVIDWFADTPLFSFFANIGAGIKDFFGPGLQEVKEKALKVREELNKSIAYKPEKQTPENKSPSPSPVAQKINRDIYTSKIATQTSVTTQLQTFASGPVSNTANPLPQPAVQVQGEQAAQALAASFVSMSEKIKAAFNDAMTSISMQLAAFKPADVIKAQTDYILQTLSALPIQLQWIGYQLMDGLIAGISEKQIALMETVGQMAYATTMAFKQPLQIHSPSRVFVELGRMVGAGAIEGLEDSSDTVASNVSRLATDTVNAWHISSNPFNASYYPLAANNAPQNYSSANSTINFSPVFNVQGSSANIQENIRQSANDLFTQFSYLMQQWQADQQRSAL